VNTLIDSIFATPLSNSKHFLHKPFSIRASFETQNDNDTAKSREPLCLVEAPFDTVSLSVAFFSSPHIFFSPPNSLSKFQGYADVKNTPQ
jgi:hypothetical protein